MYLKIESQKKLRKLRPKTREPLVSQANIVPAVMHRRFDRSPGRQINKDLFEHPIRAVKSSNIRLRGRDRYLHIPPSHLKVHFPTIFFVQNPHAPPPSPGISRCVKPSNHSHHHFQYNKFHSRELACHIFQKNNPRPSELDRLAVDQSTKKNIDPSYNP